MPKRVLCLGRTVDPDEYVHAAGAGATEGESLDQTGLVVADRVHSER